MSAEDRIELLERRKTTKKDQLRKEYSKIQELRSINIIKQNSVTCPRCSVAVQRTGGERERERLTSPLLAPLAYAKRVLVFCFDCTHTHTHTHTQRREGRERRQLKAIEFWFSELDSNAAFVAVLLCTHHNTHTHTERERERDR